MRSPLGSHMLCGQEAQQFMQAEDEVRAASEKFHAAGRLCITTLTRHQP
jgi:hypothetical protein